MKLLQVQFIMRIRLPQHKTKNNYLFGNTCLPDASTFILPESFLYNSLE